jgi:thioredoxin 1
MAEVEAIKFSATWCGPCRVVAKQLEGLDFTSIDIDEDQEGLAKKSNVRSVPTIIFMKDGVEVQRHSGLITREEYITKLETLKNQ